MTEEIKVFESRLIPIMREGVETVKMVFFKQLKKVFVSRCADHNEAYCSRLAGAIINRLFGTENPAEPFASFAEENWDIIDQEIKKIPVSFAQLCIPLTDALRVQFLCDSMEQIDSSEVLKNAEEHGILLNDREVPLPKNFLELVRRLGSGFNLLTFPQKSLENSHERI
jgi:hypothetical protein